MEIGTSWEFSITDPGSPSRHGRQFLALLLFLMLSACGGGSNDDDTPPSIGDNDQDGLSNQQESSLGTDPDNPDTDNDRLWDGDELNLFNTDPTLADTDLDNMNDGADPQPTRPNVPPTDPGSGRFVEYGVFTIRADGTAKQRISETRFEQNHVVFSPPDTIGKTFLIYQTYIEDINNDSLFNEGDLSGSVIAIMEADGSRPRYLTDIDNDSGLIASNHSVDATPEPSPDGQHIIFVSDRDNPGSLQLRLYVMDMDGGNPAPLNYESNAPANDEIDADPHWGIGDQIAFKRQRFNAGHAEFSRVYTATINTETMMLSNVVERTAGANISLATPNGPGDFDPKISPDGGYIASYRHLSDAVALFGDYDLWIGPFNDPLQPADTSISLFDRDSSIASLFPRWNLNGDKLAAWQLDGTALSNGMDALDIVVYDLNLRSSPFSVNAVKTNITPDHDGWLETMPSWNSDPNRSDEIVYSASRQF